MAKTLYITDLDGTLLNGNQRVSERTCRIINQLTSDGMLFTCATARSRFSSAKALAGLDIHLPMIVYNGAFIQNAVTGEVIAGHYLEKKQAENIINQYICSGILPIVYSFIDGRERFSYVPEQSCKGLLDFVATREGDPRLRTTTIDKLADGDIFYITAMGDESLLADFHRQFSPLEDLISVYYREIYSGDYWLELMSAQSTKAHAATQMKELLGCDRLVCFGDAVNDIPMFRMADRCCAVANADPRLKAMATDIIGSNEEDAVALWLEQYGEK